MIPDASARKAPARLPDEKNRWVARADVNPFVGFC